MAKWIYNVLMAFLFLCSSCNGQIDCLEFALEQAGTNREELEKVLKYFENDSLKYRAACFLIENMPLYGYYEGSELIKYNRYFEIYSDGKHDPHELTDSLQKADGVFLPELLTRKRDVETIDSALMVNHIEWAFKVWNEQPWGKNICWKDFCEFILPYRVGDEPLMEWREKFYNQYNPLLDSIRGLPKAEDPLFVAQFLINEWKKEPFKWTMSLPGGPHVGPDVVKFRSGTCREYTDAIAYILRSVGIPCGMDQVLLKGKNNEPHFWSFMYDKDGKLYVSEPKVWTSLDKTSISETKVYRVTFGINEDWNKKRKNSSFAIYPTFCNAHLQDVTDLYYGRTAFRITLSYSDMYGGIKEKEPVYLCLSSRSKWIPVDFALMGNDEVSFEHVGGGNVCVIATWDGNNLHVQSDPFLIDKETGNLHFYRPTGRMEEVDLYAKFNMEDGFGDFVHLMVGGVVEGCNRKDFVGADTLHLITEIPSRLFMKIVLKNVQPYRYVRYRGGKGSYCDISELFLYEEGNDSTSLSGRIIGYAGNDGYADLHGYDNVFDGDPYTSFHCKESEGGWAGIDLEYPRMIDKIVYVPRNRDNFVRQGDFYELFYWEHGNWVSLGSQMATSDVLHYTVPQGALLFLRNHTRGNAERIFEYREGRQMFR